MKKFCLKISIIILVFCLINILYKHTNYWKYENDMNKFYDVPYDIELGNFGSSHGLYGINYDFAPGIRVYNFALKGQPYFYDYALLNKYIVHFSKEAVVIFPISYFNITGYFDFSSFRKRYYRILSKEEMDSWFLKEKIIFSEFPILIAGTDLIKSFLQKPKDNRILDSVETEKLYDYCVEKHDNWTSYEWDNAEIGYQKNIENVSKMIDLCLSKYLVPVIITAPVTDVLNSVYEKDEKFFETFEKFSSDLCRKYPGLVYLDYSRDKRFISNYKLFADGDHLNYYGAEKFTEILLQDLRDKNILR